MNRCLFRPLMTAVCELILLASGVSQNLRAKSGPQARAVHPQVVARFPVDALAQLNSSLQQLASNVSPTVVQIEISGLGLTEESGRKNTGLVVRQHAIGSGVIVDPDGYIMTNAHVIDGAQAIRVILTAAIGAFVRRAECRPTSCAGRKSDRLA